MASSAGHALLVGKITNVSGCGDAAIIDKVGYGAQASCPEGGSGSAAASPGPGLSVVRRPGNTAGNGQDTDVNAADFLPPGSAVWRNTGSTPAIPPVALGNVKNSLYLAKGAADAASLAWGNAYGATGYLVYRGVTPDFMAGSPAAWATPAANSAADPEPAVPLFFYVVRATDGSSVSAE